MPREITTPLHAWPCARAETERVPRRPVPRPGPHERRRHEHPGERTHAHPR